MVELVNVEVDMCVRFIGPAELLRFGAWSGPTETADRGGSPLESSVLKQEPIQVLIVSSALGQVARIQEHRPSSTLVGDCLAAPASFGLTAH
jgi:hypothetical protein